MAGILFKRMRYDSRLSRLLRYEKRVPYLPTEIWEQILDYVIYVPFLFDARCDVENFHRFIEVHRHNPYSSHYGASEFQRKKLRLVCKMWSELMNRPYPRWIVDHIPHDFERRIDKIKRLDLGISNRFQFNLMKNPLGDEHRKCLRSILSHPKRLSSVTTVCFSLSWSEGNTWEAASFLPRLHNLPRLRSLTYIDHGSQPSNQLLQELKHSYFASLTSLYIKMWTLYGPLRLERLEVLYLDVPSHSTGQWSFPSLRHLALKGGCSGFIHSLPSRANPLGEDSSPLSGPHSHLQSLFLLEERINVTLDDLFWETYPHLRNLGSTRDGLALASNVPPDHPLYRLTVMGSLSDYDRVMLLSTQIPNLRQIYSPSHCHKVLESDAVLFSIFRDHRRRGIQWVEDDRVLDFQRKVILERQKSSIELSFWFFCSLYSYVDILLHYFKARWWEPLSPLHEGHVLGIIILFWLYLIGIWVHDRHLSPKYKWVTPYIY
ncbi:hypothetical protein CPB86DRAFT_813088 [Serendipita vermifera]|nr:hypothetical protein CPB86DRAFT_813088 [Serendipita vermifera]